MPFLLHDEGTEWSWDSNAFGKLSLPRVGRLSLLLTSRESFPWVVSHYDYGTLPRREWDFVDPAKRKQQRPGGQGILSPRAPRDLSWQSSQQRPPLARPIGPPQEPPPVSGSVRREARRFSRPVHVPPITPADIAAAE
uniref:Uncharacterized protein n=1 Tax=Sphaerodactylus townsendi TaxID=933632 RepID=A0ACB8E4I5_9SAUR